MAQGCFYPRTAEAGNVAFALTQTWPAMFSIVPLTSTTGPVLEDTGLLVTSLDQGNQDLPASGVDCGRRVCSSDGEDIDARKT